MRVIATAGHVDHGKSTLVRTLTGTDPDRLEEEKRRGLTIDLGFAGLTLPNGEPVAFVDVPGHRRFIGTMLAGLGPAPVVMFVVAADQGWQAQSSEHLDAVAALGLEHGLLVLTRCALASAERIAEVRDTALRAIAHTSLGTVMVVATDAPAGRGVDELRSALGKLVDSLPRVVDDAPVRLWVDRSFTVKGVGTVVTGTLAAGTIRVGDALLVGSRTAIVRSLEVLGEQRQTVGPVSRVALGLRGVSRDEVGRGSALMTPGAGLPERVIDVRRETGRGWFEASDEVSVHLGTAAVPAHLRPLDDEHARLTLDVALPFRLGDRLIIRDDSAARIHCGATVLDVDPAPFVRRGAARRRAEQLATWSPRRADDLVTDRGFVATSWLAQVGATGFETWPAHLPHRAPVAPDAGCAEADGGTSTGTDAVTDTNAGPDSHGVVHGYAVSADRVRHWVTHLRVLVDDDARDALSRGVPTAHVRERLDVPNDLVRAVVEAAGLDLTDGRVHGARHATGLGAAEAAVSTVRERLQANPFDAPEADDLTALGLGVRQIATAAQRGLVLRLPADASDVVLLPDAPARAMRVLAGLPQPFTTSEARQALGTTRRVVIPLLEHLDARGWTRRDGNARAVVR